MPNKNTWGDSNEDGDKHARDSGGRPNSRKKRPRSATYHRDSTTEQHAPLRSLGDSNARPQSARPSSDVRDTLPTTAEQKKSTGVPRLGSHSAQTDDSSGCEVNPDSHLISSAARVARITATAADDSQDITAAAVSAHYPDPESFFEVAFKPTGPLGITFEWAADITSWPAAGNASSPHSAQSPAAPAPPPEGSQGEDESLPPRRTRTTTTLLFASEPSVRPTSGGGNSTTSVSSSDDPPTPDLPRPFLATPPLSSRTVLPSILPPISSSTSSAASSANADPNKKFQYALRIQSFPLLPGRENLSTLPLAPTGHTATPGTNEKVNLLTTLGKSSGSQHDGRSRSTGTPDINNGANGASGNGNGPATEPLRPGDILVAVNGTPVAGPDARRAGINSFEDVVKIVAEAVNTEETTPRVLTFKRGGHDSASCLPPPIAFPPAIAPVGRGAGGAATGVQPVSGALAGVASGHEVEASNGFASSRVSGRCSRSRVVRSSTSLTLLHEGVDHADETRSEVPLISARSVSSTGTARARRSGVASGLGERAGGGRKVRSLRCGAVAVSSTVALIKEEARYANMTILLYRRNLHSQGKKIVFRNSTSI